MQNQKSLKFLSVEKRFQGLLTANKNVDNILEKNMGDGVEVQISHVLHLVESIIVFIREVKNK